MNSQGEWQERKVLKINLADMQLYVERHITVIAREGKIGGA